MVIIFNLIYTIRYRCLVPTINIYPDITREAEKVFKIASERTDDDVKFFFQTTDMSLAPAHVDLVDESYPHKKQILYDTAE